MYYYTQNLISPIVQDEPDPSAANVLQEGLGGQFGEMRTMMQYLFQTFNFRGEAIAYRDLIQGVGVEEISHVELITRTISQLLDGSARYNGTKAQMNGNSNLALDNAKEEMNPHHYIVGAQAALPVDATGNPWSGSYVHNHGNIVLDLMDNLVLEATGRLQKCRIYQMSSNKSLRATVSFLIVRDEAHQNAFAKALETLGVNWGKILPVPKFDTTQFPEVKKLMDAGIHREQYNYCIDASMMEKIYSGTAPAGDGEDETSLQTKKEPDEAYPIPLSSERKEEFSPGLDPELQELSDALSDYKEKAIKKQRKKSNK